MSDLWAASCFNYGYNYTNLSCKGRRRRENRKWNYMFLLQSLMKHAPEETLSIRKFSQQNMLVSRQQGGHRPDAWFWGSRSSRVTMIDVDIFCSVSKKFIEGSYLYIHVYTHWPVTSFFTRLILSSSVAHVIFYTTYVSCLKFLSPRRQQRFSSSYTLRSTVHH